MIQTKDNTSNNDTAISSLIDMDSEAKERLAAYLDVLIEMNLEYEELMRADKCKE